MLFVEISKPFAGDYKKTIAEILDNRAPGNDLGTIWDENRIRGAFNFGRGTVNDFIEYARRNRQFCICFNAKTGERII